MNIAPAFAEMNAGTIALYCRYQCAYPVMLSLEYDQGTRAGEQIRFGPGKDFATLGYHPAQIGGNETPRHELAE